VNSFHWKHCGKAPFTIMITHTGPHGTHAPGCMHAHLCVTCVSCLHAVWEADGALLALCREDLLH